MAQNVIDNFCRQTIPDKTLILLLNKGTEFPDVPGYRIIKILAEGKTLGAIRNEAWAFIKPNEMWANMDDDDYYGHAYLAEVQWYMRNHGPNYLYGKSTHYVSTQSMGVFEFFGGPLYLHGATLAGFGPKYYKEKDVGEDMELVSRHSVKSTSKNHYCWVRRNPAEHTYTGSDFEIFSNCQRRYPCDV